MVDCKIGLPSLTVPDGYARAASETLTEAVMARAKFPAFNSSHEGYAVMLEELDELWDDVKANNIEHAITEAIQVGAMAIRFIADMREKLAAAEARAAMEGGAR